VCFSRLGEKVPRHLGTERLGLSFLLSIFSRSEKKTSSAQKNIEDVASFSNCWNFKHQQIFLVLQYSSVVIHSLKAKFWHKTWLSTTSF